MPRLDARITFGEEQAMLLDSAASFCREHSPSRRVRAAMQTELGFERGLWDEIVALGWPGIAVPEAFGGSGLTIGEVAVIAEPMGRHLLATPFASTQLCIQGLLAGGSAALQARWLPALGLGAMGTVALFEADGDWELDRPASGCRRQGGDVMLEGEKMMVCDAAASSLILVSVTLEGEFALVAVPTAALSAGSIEREIVIDETRRAYRLRLDGLRIGDDAVIGGPAARRALRAIRDAAWLLAAAEAAGGIAGVLDILVDYLNTRTAFGRKIGSYQALKHPCADLLVALERSRSHVAHAATLAGIGGTDEAAQADAEVALRMAKAEAGDGFVQAGDRAVQFHGGFGFTYDCDAQLYLRRALWLQPWFGDAAHHRRHLAELLL